MIFGDAGTLGWVALTHPGPLSGYILGAAREDLVRTVLAIEVQPIGHYTLSHQYYLVQLEDSCSLFSFL